VSLHRYGFDAAAERFTLLANAKVSTPAQKVEALCALAVAHNGLGQAGLARSVLDRADAHAAAMETPEAATLVALVRADLIAQQRLRVHESLNDHVFWRSSEPEDAPADSPGSALTLIDDCLATQGRHALIGQRLRQLRDLLLAADGDARALAALPDHVDWLRRVGLAACAHQAQIETVLAAAAAGDVDLAQATMEPLRAGSTDHPHWRIELSYCEAKVSALAGQPVESMQHYRRYVLESMQCIRAVANATPSDSASPRSASADAPQDDVERRLPARYQPAYRYMLEHLGRRDLSIREIAEHMGISTRTLQITFERHLGMTPTEVIDRCRIERIRADLLRDAGRRTISETGARWGIPHRSTLNACYRKFFHETPSKTLARSHSGPIRS
jgi:AraC-like DNA-binding protein